MAESIDFSEVKHIKDESEENMKNFFQTENETENNIDCNHTYIRAMKEELNLEKLYNELEEEINSLLQQKDKLLNIEKEITEESSNLTVNLEKIWEETHCKFSKFSEAYKNYQSALERLFQKFEKKFQISNIPVSLQQHLRGIYSILSYDVASYKLLLISSKKAYDDFESSVNYNTTLFAEVSNNSITSLITAIDKAFVANDKLKSIFICN